ncbi:alpha-amylase [filamentous cyanobacterium LEGE 11480]|uniref:Alpha-amylase n=1 Tax=Romeriopsis navalis LEGE 11480 TaxID=2777977 RepID=A0A928VKJ4_9CYAN|nr:alpha-amylase [Romeriopsis navalis]MBE9030030.1 alpha-amylase [Romeriopsis navalis LEGE 11480]
MNGTMMQYFHWYTSGEGTHWTQLVQDADALAQAGFTALWLPPAYKGAGGGYDVGYGIYDLFDLGEFDQKGSVRTKYGTKDQYVAAVKAAQKAGMEIYADVVFNHKDGGDSTERIRATPFSRDNRNYPIGPTQDIEVYTKFDFPGRGNKYSSMKWNHHHFDSVNHNMLRQNDSSVYLFEGQGFEQFVDLEKGNYDFLLGCDLDMGNEQVRGELMYWGRWLLDTVGVDGFRLDAVKHIPAWFFRQWLDHVREHAKKPLFCVGEYWSANIETLHWYLAETGGRMSLFDVPLHHHFHQASRQGASYDLRKIFDGTLVQQQPALAVTIVENHDTQPGQSLEAPVEPWFKPLAYAMILLRQGGYPCVFHPDYYGAEYPNERGGYPVILYSHKFLLDRFLKARQENAYGEQIDYFDHPNTIGWTRLGDAAHPKAMAVVLTNSFQAYKWMDVRRPNTKFVDITEHHSEPLMTNQDGWGQFPCPDGSISVWVEA